MFHLLYKQKLGKWLLLLQEYQEPSYSLLEVIVDIVNNRSYKYEGNSNIIVAGIGVNDWEGLILFFILQH